MEHWQKIFLFAFIGVNVLLLLRGFFESHQKRNAYGLTPYLLPLGMFAWGDAVVLGIFWIAVGALALVKNDWILFLLLYSIFWVVRSLGESIYWFNQQFSPVVRTKPEGSSLYKIFHNDSVWFVVQVVHQCIAVLSIVSSLYFGKLWLRV